MERGHRTLLLRLLEERRSQLPRPALRFLDLVLREEQLLERMHLCRPTERSAVRNSVWISTEIGCWSVLLGNDPTGGTRAAQRRARLALEGLNLSPLEVVDCLRPLPVWFLALDSDVIEPPAGEAARLEHTRSRLAGMNAAHLRRTALLDQVDAALDARDEQGLLRLRRLLA